MTTIYNVSPGFLVAYSTYQGKSKIKSEDIFKSLSLEMGGDGKTITKKQLDDYISKAESGNTNIDKSKLKALKNIQKHWDTIANGDDTLTYDEMKKYEHLLLATVIGDFTKTEIEDDESSTEDAIYDYLTDYLGLNEITKSDLTNYLNDLMANSSKDDSSNNNLIDTLTNMIADFTPVSTIETEA